MKKDDAVAWLRTVVSNHVASNARRYTMQVIADESAVGALGQQVDQKPAEGKVVDGNDDWLLVKAGRSEFAIVEKALLTDIPGIGSTIRVTPYHRRRFDGKLVGTPEESKSESGLFRTQTFLIGDSDSRLPLDTEKLQSSHLKDMVNQIKALKTGDGIRNIGNALVDAGGDSPALLGWNDPSDDQAAITPPSLTFAINTLKFQGALMIEYNRAIDYYELVLTRDGKEVKRVTDIDFMSLGERIVDLVDDGKWRIPKVEMLKAAPKAKKQAV